MHNQELVIEFYNQRRKQLYECSPNAAHYALAELEKQYDVQIITQNIDDLHERAGSSKVLHLHGELKKVRSTIDNSMIYELEGWELKSGDCCEKGSQLRPHVVWFGEKVPNILPAVQLSSKADIYMVIGTSLNVYPAAGLLGNVPNHVPKYLIDPNGSEVSGIKNLTVIKEKAGKGVPELVKKLLEEK